MHIKAIKIHIKPYKKFLWSKYFYYSYFTNEETEAQKEQQIFLMTHTN